MKTIFWTGYSNNERTIAIAEIERVINTFGYITDFKLFSDTSISIKIELEELNIDKLYEDLTKNLGLDSFERIRSSSKSERVVFLNITFVKGTGYLKIETPCIQ